VFLQDSASRCTDETGPERYALGFLEDRAIGIAVLDHERDRCLSLDSASDLETGEIVRFERPNDINRVGIGGLCRTPDGHFDGFCVFETRIRHVAVNREERAVPSHFYVVHNEVRGSLPPPNHDRHGEERMVSVQPVLV